MSRDRFRELLAGLDVRFESLNDALEAGVRGLIGDAFQCGAQVDAGADHHGELGGEVQHVLHIRLAAVERLELRPQPARRAVGDDGAEVQHVIALRPKRIGGGGGVVRRDHADGNLSVVRLHLVAVVRHSLIRPSITPVQADVTIP